MGALDGVMDLEDDEDDDEDDIPFKVGTKRRTCHSTDAEGKK